MKFSHRLESIEGYSFAKLTEEKNAAVKAGRDLIDLSIGDPDLEPPRILIDSLKQVLDTKGVHKYPPYNATDDFRKAAANWLKRRHDVEVDFENELTGLIGSKEGMAHFLMAVLNEGEKVIVPSPHYPMYPNVVRLAGGEPYMLRVSEDNDFLPDLDSVSDKVWNETKVLILCYPNNPTSAVANKEFWKLAIKKAAHYGFIICSDAAYLDIYDEKSSPSMLSIPGGKEVGVEFHSLSKTFSIPGWRVAYAAGNAEIISAIRKFKQSLDSGQFTALDLATTRLLESGDNEVDGTRSIYANRRRFFKSKLEGLGYKTFSQGSTLYIWTKVPSKETSAEFAEKLLKQADVVVSPGTVFGKDGEGYIRFALTATRERLDLAAKKLCRL